MYRILKDKELVSQGKANNITGLVGYLVQLEKEEFEKNNLVDVTPSADSDELDNLEIESDDLPNL